MSIKPPPHRSPSLSQRKKIRLAPEAYLNPASTFNVTLAANSRKRLFDDPAFNSQILSLLKSLARRDGVRIKMYCLMPTHLHLLAQPGRRSLIDFIAEFKKKTADLGRAMRGIERLWQSSFFDHRLRSSESEAEQAEYIRMNPLQAGLVEHPDDWPWTGSVDAP